MAPARVLTSRSSWTRFAEPLGLLALPAQGLDHHRAVEGLVGDLADLGAQPLRPGHQGRGEPLVGEVGDHDQGEDQHPDQGQHHVGEQHLDHGDRHHHHGAERHRQRSNRAPGRLDVGVGVGEQLAGGVALVPLHGQGEVLPGDGPSGVGLHPELHDPGAEAPRHDADRTEDGDAEEQREHGPEQGGVDLAVLEGGDQHVVGGPAEHPGVGDGQQGEQHAADGGEDEDAGFAADGVAEYGEAFARRRSAQLRLLVRHVFAVPLRDWSPSDRHGHRDCEGIPPAQPLTTRPPRAPYPRLP